MPLLVHAVAWWLVGLIAPLTVVLWLVLGTSVAAWWRGLPRVLLAASLAGPLAALTADVARHDREYCRRDAMRRLATRVPVWGRVDASPQRTRIPVTLTITRDGPCRVAAWVRVNGAAPSPGAYVSLIGTGRVLERGLRIDEATISAQHDRDPLTAWRGRVGVHIDQRFGSRAPLVRALLIADQRALDVQLRDQYADAGLVHMLSVSGLHVAIIASALVTVGGMVRIPMVWVEPLALLIVLLYVAALGAPPPAVRSAIMLVVTALARRWQRPVHAWTALALGAMVPTVSDPLVVSDLGWQLSVAGMAALLAAGALQRRWRAWAHVETGQLHWWRRAACRAWRWRGWRATLLGELTTGTFAVLATAPIIAWHFGQLSLVAPLSNLVAAPIVAVLQPALFLAMLLEPLDSAAQFVADATQPAMALLDVVATTLGQWTWSVAYVAPDQRTALLTGAAALLVLRATRAVRMTPWFIGAFTFGVLALWWPLGASQGSGAFEVHVLDVGQGDALALRTPKGRWILIDAGPRWDGGDAARRRIVPWVRRRGGAVALFVLTHPHEDHVGGAPTVIQALAPRLWWEAAFVGTSPGYRESLAQLARHHIPWRRVTPGDRFQLDGVTLDVLAPDPVWVARQSNANETSVVIMASYGAHRFLFTGDAEGGEEAWLLRQSGALRADVLKLGHHGSRTSTSAALLEQVQPRVAVASVGAGNRYGHPAPLTQYQLLRHQVPMLRTDLDGTVIFRSTGRVLTVENEQERWTVPERGR